MTRNCARAGTLAGIIAHAADGTDPCPACTIHERYLAAVSERAATPPAPRLTPTERAIRDLVHLLNHAFTTEPDTPNHNTRSAA